MKLIILIAVCTLLNFVTSEDGSSTWPEARTLLTSVGRRYKCPPFPRISPEISLSPFQVTSDSHDGISSDEQPLTIIPVSVRSFSKLGLLVLPSREVCIVGQKLPKIILPNDPDSKFEIMTGIAIWFSPCIQRTTESKRDRCFTRQMKEFNKLDVNEVKSLHGLLSKFLEHI